MPMKDVNLYKEHWQNELLSLYFANRKYESTVEIHWVTVKTI